jgi:cellulose synthase (UDP-forming)
MPNQDYRYNYIVKNPSQLRRIYFVILITWLIAVFGIIRFFNLSIWYWILMFPLFFPSIYSRTTDYILNVFYPGFDLDDHERIKDKFWKKNNPTVDIFLPICGESIDIFRPTWEAVTKLNYDNYKVYVLEDRVDLEARKLAKDLGFKYLSRPNKGELKKAGNIHYGVENSDGEFIVILDADFIPHVEFIRESVPYFANPKIGILQTPQYFDVDDKVHKRSMIEFGAGHVVEDFYRILQPARDTFNAAICVGTNSIHRRSAIHDSHAPKLAERCEDVVAGLTMLKHGYELKYIPIILAKGICPDNVESYFKQHNRWGAGSVELFFSAFFWRIKMSTIQRLIHVSSTMYYFGEASALIVSAQLFLLLFLHQGQLTFIDTLWFAPFIFAQFFLLPLTRLNQNRRGTVLAAITQVYTYFYAIATLISGSTMEWVPTNAQNKKISVEFVSMAWLNRLFIVVWVILGVIIYNQNPEIIYKLEAYPLLIALIYSLLVHVFFALNVNRYIAVKNDRVSFSVRIMQLVVGLFELLSIPLYKIPGVQNAVEYTLSVITNPVAYRLTANGIVIGVIFATSSALIYENINGSVNLPNLNNGQGIERIIDQIPSVQLN